MKANTIISIALISLWCVSVYAQTAAPVPAPVLTELTNLRTDVKQMKASGKFDTQKTLSDLQALMTAVQTNLKDSPQATKDKMSPIIASLAKAKSSAADEKAVKELMQTTMQFVEQQYPGARMDDKENGTTKAPGKN